MINYNKYINAASMLFRFAVVILFAAAASSCGNNRGKDKDSDIAGSWKVAEVEITGADPQIYAGLFDLEKLKSEIAEQRLGFSLMNDSTLTVRTKTEIVGDGRWSYNDGVLECKFDKAVLSLKVEEITADSMRLALLSLDGIDDKVSMGIALARTFNIKLLLSCTREDLILFTRL